MFHSGHSAGFEFFCWFTVGVGDPPFYFKQPGLAFIDDALQVVACGGSLNFPGIASTWTRIERLEPVVLVHRRFVLSYNRCHILL